MFEQLLNVKQQRERSAANGVRKQHLAVEAQANRVQDAIKAAAEFREFRTRQEDALFEEIRGEPVHLKDLQLMQAKVASLRQQEAAQEEQVRTEETQLDTEKETLEQRRGEHRVALRGREKFLELAAEEKRNAEQASALLEDAEAEEISAARWRQR